MMDLIHKCDDGLDSSRSKAARKGFVLICSCCNEVLSSPKSWPRGKVLSGQEAAALSHGLCATCYEEQRAAFRESKSQRSVDSSAACGKRF